MAGAARARRDRGTLTPRGLLVGTAAGILAAACALGGESESPARTPNIQRAKLDIAYTALTDNDVHMVSSKKVLTEALEAVRRLARQNAGWADVATPEFQDVSEPVIADFKKFAEAMSRIAERNPALQPDQIADTVLRSYTRSSPDCHTYYVPKRGALAGSGTAAALPRNRDTVPAADEAGLEFRLLPGGIGYLTWHEFAKTGTYDITTEVRKALDALLAMGARAWILDLRGNVGGDPPQAMASWFLRGEPTITFQTRTGSAGTQAAVRELRLPDEYQLPLAVILNRASGSSPEILALALKENRRATIVGERSAGCIGNISPLYLPDGSFFAVVATEFVGAITGARYNNVGIPPDVPANDATAIASATRILLEQIAQRATF